MALTKSFAHVLVPGIGRDFQFGMLVFESPESKLLHEVGEKCRARVELRIDFEKLAHWRELNLLDVARAIAAQFPVMSQGKMDHDDVCLAGESETRPCLN